MVIRRETVRQLADEIGFKPQAVKQLKAAARHTLQASSRKQKP